MTFNPNNDPQALAQSSSVGMFLSVERYNRLLECERELSDLKNMNEGELCSFVIKRTYTEFIRERGTNRWFPLSRLGIHLPLPIEADSCPGINRGEFWRTEQGVLQWNLEEQP